MFDSNKYLQVPVEGKSTPNIRPVPYEMDATNSIEFNYKICGNSLLNKNKEINLMLLQEDNSAYIVTAKLNKSFSFIINAKTAIPYNHKKRFSGFISGNKYRFMFGSYTDTSKVFGSGTLAFGIIEIK